MPVTSALLSFHAQLYCSVLFRWLFFFAVSPKILADYSYSAGCKAKKHSMKSVCLIRQIQDWFIRLLSLRVQTVFDTYIIYLHIPLLATSFPLQRFVGGFPNIALTEYNKIISKVHPYEYNSSFIGLSTMLRGFF